MEQYKVDEVIHLLTNSAIEPYWAIIEGDISQKWHFQIKILYLPNSCCHYLLVNLKGKLFQYWLVPCMRLGHNAFQIISFNFILEKTNIIILWMEVNKYSDCGSILFQNYKLCNLYLLKFL